MSLQLNSISKTFATRSLFEGLTLQIGEKSRVGLIGRNGCGKSTLLKLIMNQLQPDEGSIYRAPGIKINYLSQEPRITPTFTLEEEMRSVFTELHELERKEAELIRKLNEAPESDTHHMELAESLHGVHAEMERLGAYSMDARISRILKGLGFSLADHQRKTSEFSGGWQMRINLAKVLLEGADILLLDEPTNHLDLEACEWLETFLKEYPGGLMLVSHDRRFLDQVATEIAELESGGMKVWPGNYTTHLELKAAELEQLTSAHDRQQKELAKQTAFVDRFRASATRSTQAKSREKQLAKIERIELPQHDNRRMAFSFPTPPASGKEVLTLRNVSKSFGDKALFQKLEADLGRQQRVFLLGGNGTGKTTLLRLILGLESPDSGHITQGHNVEMGYFSQNQLDTLDAKMSVFDSMQETAPQLDNTELRTLLGRFLFTGDQVFKPISVLSGGEKSKLALAKLMMSGCNTLLLDEPTNHMDIPSKEVMTDALLEYEGSMLCISHDRYFIQELATDIWEIYNGHLITYGGDYEYYRFKRDELRARVNPDAFKSTSAHNQQGKKNGKKNSNKNAAKETSTRQPAPMPVAEVPMTELASAEASKAAVTKKAAANSPLSGSASGKPGGPLQARKELEKSLKKLERSILGVEQAVESLEAQLHDPALQQDYQKLHAITLELEQRKQSLAELNEQWTELAEALSQEPTA